MPTPECSLERWKAVPTTAEVLFSLRLPYKPPRSPVAAFIWRKRLWFETTFGLESAESWEKVLVLMVYLTPFVLLLVIIYSYLPTLVQFLQRRAVHHLTGHEPYAHATAKHVLTGWAAGNASGEL
ncbi:hypothetical protein BKA93DRAFT_749825 [Sparassis latifolia]|uniref:Uncharacterized protein n=1 Tax=Sparassis crispa TaxID=139825 RepID=A0A401GS69_9APHY|nr:hypothetical protein SCP_0702420 [Sparassis crispa]GBE85056.1 hypothetical protein SCP_0702420 [Sparassis crispa]